MRFMPLVALGLAVAACSSPSGQTPAPQAFAPASAVTTDPIRGMAAGASDWFSRPRANQPAQAARAIAAIEDLAVAVPQSAHYASRGGNAVTQLAQSRNEARRELSVPANADAAAVAGALREAATALDANNRAAAQAALPASIFTAGPAATIQRLSRPPRVPSARSALTSLTLGSGSSGN
jgi:putative hemolysin